MEKPQVGRQKTVLIWQRKCILNRWDRVHTTTMHCVKSSAVHIFGNVAVFGQ